MRRLIVTVATLGVLGLTASCTSVDDPFTNLLITGTVTQDGAPATARVTLTAQGFSSSVRTEPDGTYSITTGGGGVPRSYCGSVRLTAELFDAAGTSVVDEETRNIGACGEHTVDFDFS